MRPGVDALKQASILVLMRLGLKELMRLVIEAWRYYLMGPRKQYW